MDVISEKESSKIHFSFLLDFFFFFAGYFFYKRKKYDKAINCFNKALKYNPEFAKCWFFLGETYQKTGKLKEALHAIQMVTKLVPKDYLAFAHLSQIHGNLGNYQKAIDYSHKSLHLKENHRSFHNLACLYVKTDDFILAQKYYQKALEINPDDFDSLLNFSHALLKANEIDKAIIHLKSALKKYPNDKYLLFNLGISHLVNSNNLKAKACFQLALKIDPDFSKAKSKLAQITVNTKPVVIPPKTTKASDSTSKNHPT